MSSPPPHFDEAPWPDDDPPRQQNRPKEPVRGPFSRTFREIEPAALDPRRRPPPRRYLLVTDPPADGPDREWVGVLPAGRVAMLAAAGGVGKTYAMVQLAIAIATGTRWLDAWQPQGAGRILLALCEEDADEAQRRLWYVADALGLDDDARAEVLKRVRLMPLVGQAIMLTNEQGQRTDAHRDLMNVLRAEAGPDGWAAVLLDPFARLGGPAAEKDNALATAVIASLEALTEAPGNPTVLVAHHTSQAARQDGRMDATAARGVTALTDGIRWQATMAPVKDSRELVMLAVGKTNYGPHPPPLILTRSRYGVLRKADDQVLASANAGPAADTTSAAEDWLRSYVGANPGKSGRQIDEACKKVNGGPGYRQVTLAAARETLEQDGEIEKRGKGWFLVQEARDVG